MRLIYVEDLDEIRGHDIILNYILLFIWSIYILCSMYFILKSSQKEKETIFLKSKRNNVQVPITWVTRNTAYILKELLGK